MASVKEAVEAAGFGPGQMISAIAACGVFFAEGLELLLVSLLAPSIAADLNVAKAPEDVTGVSEGFLLTSVFAGALIGNAAGGPLADRVGRQFPITIAGMVVCFFGVLSTFANSLASISVLRGFVGLGFGLGQPAAVALLNEITPERWRLTTTALSSIAFGCGALLAVVIAVGIQDPYLDSQIIEWRLALRVGSGAVTILWGVSVFCLPESPVFLASAGDFAYARDTLQALRARNGMPGERIAFRQPTKNEVMATPLAAYFGQAEYMPSLVVGLTSLVVNFALYGSGYAVPWVVMRLQAGTDRETSDIAPASVLLISIFAAGVTLLLFVLCGNTVSRKMGIISCLTAGMFACVVFNSIRALENLGSRLLLVGACFGLCAGPAFCYIMLVQVSAVMYPAARSATDVAACIALGRVGSIAAPVVFDAVSVAAGGNWQTFFNAMAILELTCAVLLIPMEFGLEYPYATFLGPDLKGTV